MLGSEKVIIVEGKTDKKKLEEIIIEPIEIICTHGTVGIAKLEELVAELYEKDVYILVDTDQSGAKLRKQLRQEFPHARHLYVDRMYREVATSPMQHLAQKLANAFIEVDPSLLFPTEKRLPERQL